MASEFEFKLVKRVSTILPNIEIFLPNSFVSFFHEQQYGIGKVVSIKDNDENAHIQNEYLLCKYVGLYVDGSSKVEGTERGKRAIHG